MYIAVHEDLVANDVTNMGTADQISNSLKNKEERLIDDYVKEGLKVSKIEFYIDCEGEWFYNVFRDESPKEEKARIKKKKFMSEIAKVAAATRKKHTLMEKQKLYEQLKKELGHE